MHRVDAGGDGVLFGGACGIVWLQVAVAACHRVVEPFREPVVLRDHLKIAVVLVEFRGIVDELLGQCRAIAVTVLLHERLRHQVLRLQKTVLDDVVVVVLADDVADLLIVERHQIVVMVQGALPF